MNNLSVTITV